MDYDKLLDDWFDKVVKESDKHQKVADRTDEYNYKKGYNSGFSNGLLFATSILSRMEKKFECKVRKPL